MHLKPATAHRFRFCSPECRRASVDAETPQRFWALVDKTSHPGGCWIYTGRVNAQRGGYGIFDDHRVTKRAHRYAWEQTNGPIPDGLEACHRCDNPPCVRPDHLFLGTSQDNSDDCVAKGRMPHGEEHGVAKLTNQQAQEIRVKHAGGATCISLSREFNVSPTLVGLIVRGKIRKRHHAASSLA